MLYLYKMRQKGLKEIKHYINRTKMTSNILDQPIPEINVPILKPVKAKRVGVSMESIKRDIQRKLNEFADWIISYVPPQVKKKLNERVENLKKQVREIYEKQEPKKYIREHKSALKGFVTSYRIEGIKGIDPRTFLHDNQDRVLKLIRKREKPIKMKLLLEIVFQKMGNTEMFYSYGYFHSEIVIITEATNVEEEYEKLVQNILEKIEVYQHRGSGWIFESISKLDIHIDKYQPIAATSYVELPKELKDKRAVINVENEDNQCFKWAITSCLFPAKRDGERISKTMKSNAKKLNWDGLEFPVQIDKIDIFETNNPQYAINVYGYKNEKVYPLRISNNDNREKTIDLLMISNDETNQPTVG